MGSEMCIRDRNKVKRKKNKQKTAVRREWWKGSKTITDLSVEHLGSIQIGVKYLNALYIYDNNDALVHTDAEYN